MAALRVPYMVPLDPSGNYYAALPDPANGNGVVLGSVGSGAGAPTGSTTVTTVYINTSNGDVYSYVNGAWVKQTGTGTGTAQQVYTYTSGTPQTPADPTKPAWAYDPTGNLQSLGWRTDTQAWQT